MIKFKMKNVTRLRRYGFRQRMSTKKGRLTINRRRSKGRKLLGV